MFEYKTSANMSRSIIILLFIGLAATSANAWRRVITIGTSACNHVAFPSGVGCILYDDEGCTLDDWTQPLMLG